MFKKWNKLTKHMRKAIRRKKLSCNCTIDGCHSNNCVRLMGDQSHSLTCDNTFFLTRTCHEENGICTEKKGICQWSKSSLKRIRKCMRNGSSKATGSNDKHSEVAFNI